MYCIVPHTITLVCPQTASQLVRLFFAGLNGVAAQIDTQTTEQAACVAIGHIYPMRMIRPKKHTAQPIAKQVSAVAN